MSLRLHHADRSPVLFGAVLLLCGLMLSVAVMPTLLSVKWNTTVVSPMPVEEEHSHSGQSGKVQEALQNGSWCSSSLLFGQRVLAAFRASDEALPSHPVAPALERPPRYI